MAIKSTTNDGIYGNEVYGGMAEEGWQREGIVVLWHVRRSCWCWSKRRQGGGVVGGVSKVGGGEKGTGNEEKFRRKFLLGGISIISV